MRPGLGGGFSGADGGDPLGEGDGGVGGDLAALRSLTGVDHQVTIGPEPVLERPVGALHLDAEGAGGGDETGLDHADRTVRAGHGDHGVVLDPAARHLGVCRGCDLHVGAQDELGEVDRVGGKVAEGAADGLGSAVEALGQPVAGRPVVGEAHAGVGQATQDAGVQHLPQGDRVAVGQAGQGHGDLHAGRAGGGQEFIGLLERGGQQFLGEHVLARRDHLADDLAVRGGRGGDGDAVQVRTGQQGVEVLHRGDGELLGEHLAAVEVLVPDGDELGVGVVHRGTGVLLGMDMPGGQCSDAQGCGHGSSRSSGRTVLPGADVRSWCRSESDTMSLMTRVAPPA
jgi:hypothetical protein